MDEYFPPELNKLRTGDLCNVRSGTAVKEADGALLQALALNLTHQTTQLWAVQLHKDGDVGW